MRSLLRRFAWLVARLLIVLVLSFVVLAQATRAPRHVSGQYASDRVEELQLPAFFNPQPADLESRVNAIVEHLSRGPSEKDANELLRLGGASLPLLLPRLSKLPVATRARIAWDLLPLAQRMTWRGASEVTSEARAYDYFVEMWKERSIDYQPAIVARWVERLALRGGIALTLSVIEYDTYALPPLMAALSPISTATDVEHVRPLLSVLRRITGLPWTLPTPCGVDEARFTVDRWQRWWRLHAMEFTYVRGPSRWSAMLTETQFGQWTALALRHRFGATRDHRPILPLLGAAAMHSGILLFSGTAGAIGVAIFKRRRPLRPAASASSRGLGLALRSIPQVSIVAGLAMVGLSRSLLAAAIVACIAIAHLDLENIHQLDAELPARLSSSRATVTQRPRRRQTLPNWLFAGHTWPFLLTLVFLVEQAFGQNGLGRCCVEAFRRRDLHLLMAVTTITALWLLLIELAVQLNHPLRIRRPTREQSQ